MANQIEKLKTKRLRTLLTLFIGFVSFTGIAQTQAEMNEQANESYRQVDAELNEIYNKILFEYKSDTAFIKNLKASQRIWITFRDAELKVKYPDITPGTYGSVYPTCVSIYLENLTRERIRTLTVWIEGIEEGELCRGSVKTKE